MPSSVTVVPGSQGPRQSGSVRTPTWHASTAASFSSAAVVPPWDSAPSDVEEGSVAVEEEDEDDDDDEATGIGELAASHCRAYTQHNVDRGGTSYGTGGSRCPPPDFDTTGQD